MRTAKSFKQAFFQLTIAYGFAAIIHSKCGEVHNIISPPLQIANPHTPRDMVCPHEYAIYMWSGAQPTWSTDTLKFLDM
jgi:hypothetical protein